MTGRNKPARSALLECNAPIDVDAIRRIGTRDRNSYGNKQARRVPLGHRKARRAYNHGEWRGWSATSRKEAKAQSVGRDRD